MEQKGDEVGPYPVPYSIYCAKRVELEDFTLTLSGHDFVITPYEYTIEMDAEEWGGHRCISAIVPMQDFGEKFIMVGSSFLRAFYAVLHHQRVLCRTGPVEAGLVGRGATRGLIRLTIGNNHRQ